VTAELAVDAAELTGAGAGAAGVATEAAVPVTAELAADAAEAAGAGPAELAGAVAADAAEVAGAGAVVAEVAGVVAEVAGSGAGAELAGAADAAEVAGAVAADAAVVAGAGAGAELAGAAGVVAEVTGVEVTEVAACACRENTSKTTRIPAATIATCTARRAMRRKIGCGMSNSRTAGTNRTRFGLSIISGPKHAGRLLFQVFSASVTRNRILLSATNLHTVRSLPNSVGIGPG
jgi:hypothetical protein